MADVEQLQHENEHLRRILDIARYMAVTNDLDVLLGTIVEATCEVLHCDRATIFLFDAETNELYSRVAKGIETIRFPADKGIAGQAAQERACVNVPDAYADARFNQEVDKQTGYHTRTLLTFPLENIQGDLIGVLQALNKRDRPFGEQDEELARVLSAQAGVALDRGRLLEEFAEKQRMQHDLEVARGIQQSLFPKENPVIEGYEVAGWNRPADETGGDAYDFIPLQDGRLAVFLADATGHGIGAALVIAQGRSLLRAMLSVTQDLPTIAAGVNDLLAEDLDDGRFVTAFIGILDPRAHALEYVSGGQGPLLLVSPNSVESRIANAVPFAVIPGVKYDAPERFELSPGATLVLLTDGFYEAVNPDDEQFGEKRVVEFVKRKAAVPLPQLIDDLHADIEAFTQGCKQADDLTAVLIRRSG
ncbi:MAG: SpoIIE family protein phosphatase [Planctomycetes bacterium]|nr:SpoIIE family protein phosphatase [Planctomycetota bacterium]